MRVKLSDVAKFSKGVQINSEDLIEDGQYIYLNGGIKPSGRLNSTNVSKNTITVSEGGNSSGYINYITEPFWCGAHCYYLYDVPNNAKYLYYALKSQQERLCAIRSGACMPNIKKADLGKFDFEFDFDEQKQFDIVNSLDIAQRIINARHQQLQDLDDLIKARFIEVLTPLLEAGDTVPLNNLIVEGRPITYGILKPGTNVEGGIPVVKVKDMVGGAIDESDLLHTTQEIDNVYKRSKLNEGDLLISIRGSVGRTAIVPASLQDANITQDTARLSIKPEYSTMYVRGVLESQPMQLDMEHNIRGVAVKGINIGYLRQLGIPVADRATQDRLEELYIQSDKSKVIERTALLTAA